MLKLLRLLRTYRRSVALILVLALAQSLANLSLPRLMADIVDEGIVKGDTRRRSKSQGAISPSGAAAKSWPSLPASPRRIRQFLDEPRNGKEPVP